MNDVNALQKALHRAVVAILRPLVRLLLRHGISFQAFADMARWVYVDVAHEDFALAGRKPTKSRVAVLTGLSRRVVDETLRQPVPGGEVEQCQYNRAGRVLTRWATLPGVDHFDSPYRRLPMQADDGPSFEWLMKQTGNSDTPVRAMLDELQRLGAVSVDAKAGVVNLIKGYYEPLEATVGSCEILGLSAGALLDTIDNNLSGGTVVPRYQRTIYSDRLPLEVLPMLKREISRKAQELEEEIDREITRMEVPVDQDAPPGGMHVAGLGLYYFELPDGQNNTPTGG